MNEEQEELDMTFVVLLREWKRKAHRNVVGAQDVVLMLENLWEEVLRSQGRTQLDLNGKVFNALNYPSSYTQSEPEERK